MAITNFFITGIVPQPLPQSPGPDGQVAFTYDSDTTNPTTFYVTAKALPSGAQSTVGSATYTESGNSIPQFIPIDTEQLTAGGDYEFFIYAQTAGSPESYFSNVVNPVEIVCFVSDTMIATDRGEVAVQALRAGDLVVTMHGAQSLQPVLWIGHTRVNLRRHPNPGKAAPILIRSGALSPGIPHRDLRVSPEHALFLDGHLVPARLLVNGATIVQELWRDEVTYWHVELPAHGLLVAEGAVAESYFDDGNRKHFDNGVVTTLVKDFASERANGRYAEAACYPLLLEGPALDHLRARVSARADARLKARATA
jgi:hypothetical protein